MYWKMVNSSMTSQFGAPSLLLKKKNCIFLDIEVNGLDELNVFNTVNNLYEVFAALQSLPVPASSI